MYWEYSTVTHGKLGCSQLPAQGEAPQGGQGKGVQPDRQTDMRHPPWDGGKLQENRSVGHQQIQGLARAGALKISRKEEIRFR